MARTCPLRTLPWQGRTLWPQEAVGGSSRQASRSILVAVPTHALSEPSDEPTENSPGAHATQTWRASAEALGELYPDQFFDLCKAVFEVNLDFFGRRLLPMVREAMVTARRNGGLSSQPSSAAGSAAGSALPLSES